MGFSCVLFDLDLEFNKVFIRKIGTNEVFNELEQGFPKEMLKSNFVFMSILYHCVTFDLIPRKVVGDKYGSRFLIRD